jgi:hypothetical protein
MTKNCCHVQCWWLVAGRCALRAEGHDYVLAEAFQLEMVGGEGLARQQVLGDCAGKGASSVILYLWRCPNEEGLIE